MAEPVAVESTCCRKRCSISTICATSETRVRTSFRLDTLVPNLVLQMVQIVQIGAHAGNST